ncbi:SusC/RagA family TonB-linked outer membrane protein [Chitinophaga niastensis]|uniref:SusC/RagA family TonB-linked outer membrane protein n=1 Tax=Chitinophaga niastensis TaxID=536980 RepID=UPI001304E1DF|nr:SusC/RagA family TonB-linked outer membrane protein [Chitinophaga niastensis]
MDKKIPGITINAGNALDAVKEIEKLTGLNFAYNANQLKNFAISRQVYENKTLREVLNGVLKNTRSVINEQSGVIVILPGAGNDGPSSRQGKKTTGIVSDKSGPLPGVTVLEKGTTNGAISDENGRYAIKLKSLPAILVFSITGLKKQEQAVEDEGTLNVTMEGDLQKLGEVVVTALGIKREERSLGYAIQKIGGEQVDNSKFTDLKTALAGKIAGAQLVGAPSSTFRDAGLRLRGANSLSGGSPIYVLDGTIISHTDINLDNIESISVLKGAAATALYGIRAAAGAVLLTSKTGQRNQKMRVEVNSGTAFERLSVIPAYQNIYGAGDNMNFDVFHFDPNKHPADWKNFDGQKMVQYYMDQSWGPKMDGTMVREWFSWYPGEDFGKQTPFVSHPNNVRDFFRTGINLNNSVAFSGGSEKASYRLSYANQYRDLIYPNANRKRNFIDFAGNFDVTDKFTVFADINVVSTKQIAEPFDGGNSNQRSIMAQFNQEFQRSVDMKRLWPYKTPDGTYRTWNIVGPNGNDSASALRPRKRDNPYSVYYESYRRYSNFRIFGNTGFNYKILPNLKLQSLIRADIMVDDYDDRVASGTVKQDMYKSGSSLPREFNYEMTLNYNKQIHDLSIDALAGGNIRHFKFTRNEANTVGGLSIPNLYAITASNQRPNAFNDYQEQEVRSVYGKVSLGYKRLLYVDLTGRNDWSSTLPVAKNYYFYPSVSTSFIFTELLPHSNWLSFGKVRLGVAQAGSDAGIYAINTGYNLQNPYGSSPAINVPDKLVDPRLSPSLSTSIEGGLALKLLNNRIGVDVSIYKNKNTKQVTELQISETNGYSSYLTNLGEIQSKGVDIAITATPIRNKVITWDVYVNAGTNKSKVIDLAANMDNYLAAGRENGLRLELDHRKGAEWGLLVGPTFQYYQAKDANGKPIASASNGKPIVNTNGAYLTNENQPLGSILPKFTGGLGSTIVYKNFDFSFAIDYQVGGKFLSLTKMFLLGTGLDPSTVGTNDKGNDWRLPVAQGGGIKPDGVLADGTPFTGYVEARTYYWTYLFNKVAPPFIFDASYVKLRELRLGYTFAMKPWYKRAGFTSLNVALYAQNPWLIYTALKGIDTSELESFWEERGQVPATRTIGFNLKLVL